MNTWIVMLTSAMLVDSEAEKHGIDRLVASAVTSAVTRMKEGD